MGRKEMFALSQEMLHILISVPLFNWSFHGMFTPPHSSFPPIYLSLKTWVIRNLPDPESLPVT